MLTFPRARRARRGLTLVELMVATGLMLALGLMLITSLNTTVKIVNTGSSRGDAWIRGQSLIERIESDLTQLHVSDEKGRLSAGIDPLGRPFLVFTRALPEERQSAAGIFAAEGTIAKGYSKSWRGRNAQDAYRPMGGVAAVAYVFEDNLESENLFRGVVAPIGVTRAARYGKNAQVSGSADLFEDLSAWHITARGENRSFPANRSFGRVFDLASERVLYCGIEFHEELLADGTVDGDGWRYHWESSPRSALQNQIRGSRSWPTEHRSQATERALASGGVQEDLSATMATPFRRRVPINLGMGFPARARITVTIAFNGPDRAETVLAKAIGSSDREIELDDGFEITESIDANQNFVRIGAEWVRFESISGNTLLNCKRGMRGTIASEHDGQAYVLQGLSISKTIDLPAGDR